MTDPSLPPTRPVPSGRHRRPGRFEPLARLRGRRTAAPTGGGEGTGAGDRPAEGTGIPRTEAAGRASAETGDTVRTGSWERTAATAPDPWLPLRAGAEPDVRARPRTVTPAAQLAPLPPVWADALPAWVGPSRQVPREARPDAADDADADADADDAWSALEPEPGWGPRTPAGPAPDDSPAVAVRPAGAATVPTPRRGGVPVGPHEDRNGTGPWAELRLSDGRTLDLTGTALIGRDPAPRVGESPGTLVAVPDPGRSVSKTHLGVGVDAGGAWVVDRQSTNGTVVTLPDGQQILCVPERRVRLPSGASVSFGDHRFTLTAVRTATSHEQEHTTR
jgi:hypothetical protein